MIDIQTVHHFLRDLGCKQLLVKMKWHVIYAIVPN